MLSLLLSSCSCPAWLENTRTPCMGHGDGVCGTGGIATRRNATGQQGSMGNSSCPSCVPNHHVEPGSLQDLPEQVGCRDPVLCPPRALTLHHSLSLWVCLLLTEEAGTEKEAQDRRVLPAPWGAVPRGESASPAPPGPARGPPVAGDGGCVAPSPARLPHRLLLKHPDKAVSS